MFGKMNSFPTCTLQANHRHHSYLQGRPSDSTLTTTLTIPTYFSRRQDHLNTDLSRFVDNMLGGEYVTRPVKHFEVV